MIQMTLGLNIDARKFMQAVQINNEQVAEEVQAGIDRAIEELSQDGVIEKLVAEAVKKNILDGVTSFMMRYDIRKKIEDGIKDKTAEKVKNFTDKIVDDLADKLGMDKK